MEHKRSKIKVYVSDEYKTFATVDGNRSINKSKVNRILKEIEEGNDVLDEFPILVREENDKLLVIDGQHRLVVAKTLGRPVHYIIRKQHMSLYNIAKVNSNTEKWRDVDFINCYVKAGNNNYKMLHNFCMDYSISAGIATVLLYNGTLLAAGAVGGKSRKQLRGEFETGAWVCRKPKEARIIMEQCKNFSAFSGWNSRAFITAICMLMEKDVCKFDRLVEKFQRNPSRLTNTGNYKECLTQLELIYNLDNQKRIQIY